MNPITKTAILIPACAIAFGLSVACATPAPTTPASVSDRNLETLPTVAAVQQPQYTSPVPATRIAATPTKSAIITTTDEEQTTPVRSATATPAAGLRSNAATPRPTPPGSMLQAEPTSTPSPTATPQPTPTPTAVPEHYGSQFSDAEIKAFIDNDLGGRPQGKPLPYSGRCTDDQRFDATAEGLRDTPAYQFLTANTVIFPIMEVFKEAVHQYEAEKELRRNTILGPRRNSYVLSPDNPITCFQSEVMHPRYPVIRYTWEFMAKLPEGTIPDGHAYYGMNNFRFQAFFIVDNPVPGEYQVEPYPRMFYSAGHPASDLQLLPDR